MARRKFTVEEAKAIIRADREWGDRPNTYATFMELATGIKATGQTFKAWVKECQALLDMIQSEVDKEVEKRVNNYTDSDADFGDEIDGQE